MAVDLVAGLPVGDYERALDWYERLLGSVPSFLPNATEAVWELAEHLFVTYRDPDGNEIGSGEAPLTR